MSGSLMRHPLVDEVIDTHRARFGQADPAGYEGYRGHAHHVFLFTRHLVGARPELDDRIALAAAYHDLAAFEDGLDYLGPSIDLALEHLARIGRTEWSREVSLTIAMHHRALPYRGEAAELVEPFRRSDWCEVLFGRVRMGIPRQLIRDANEQFPLGSFFTRTIPRETGKWIVRHPLNPLPFMRGTSAMRDHPPGD